MNLFERIKNFPFHTFIFAIFPALTLLAHNIYEISASDALRAIFLSFLMAGILLVVMYILTKDLNKAAIITTIAMALFFSYGHAYSFLEPVNLAGLQVGRHRILAPLYLVIFAFSAWIIKKSRWIIQSITQVLNILTIVLLIYPSYQIVSYYWEESNVEEANFSDASFNLPVQGKNPLPDIYYIILDGYARDDVLDKLYDFDNESFLHNLEEVGFFVGRCSRSNYAQTQLSLASSLSMNYIDELGSHYTGDSTDRSGLPGRIKKSAVSQYLDQFGYVTVAFETGYNWTQIKKADIYLSPNIASSTLLGITGGLNGFEVLLIKTSAGLIAIDAASILPEFLQDEIDYPNKVHRERVLFTLDQLGKLPNMPGPKFVFAHIVSPHPPYVFGPDGEIVDREVDDIEGYRNQVAYLNSQIVPLLRQMIANSDPEPIIIIQADHGGVKTTSEDRLSILNAYYLPDGGDRFLYENISPVNTFRVILNHYFGADYELLEDLNYYSSYDTPYQYTLIPDPRTGCEP